MLRDHRPYTVKRAYLKLQHWYTRHFLRPQFARLGMRPLFIKPWHVEVFGGNIHVGDYAVVIAAPDARVRLAVWPPQPDQGRITIGDCCMICPGVRISSALRIDIGDNCMIASRAYITDSDWHGLYDRISSGRCLPVRIGSNAWVGDSVIICKGVSVGDNSIIGAGAVVVDDVPANTVAAGNPARPVRRLDPQQPRVTRAHWYADPHTLFSDITRIDREMLADNTVLHWLRHLVFPTRGD